MKENFNELNEQMIRLQEIQNNLNKMDRLSLSEACGLWYYFRKIKKQQEVLNKVSK